MTRGRPSIRLCALLAGTAALVATPWVGGRLSAAPASPGRPSPLTASQGIAVPTGEVASAAGGVTLQRPATWVMKSDGAGGMTIAALQVDLSALVPVGPRLRVERVAVDPAKALERISTTMTQGEPLQVIGEPGTMRIGTLDAAVVTFQEDRGERTIVVKSVAVVPAPARSYLFTLESPAEQWKMSEAVLTAIVEGARFSAGGFPGRWLFRGYAGAYCTIEDAGNNRLKVTTERGEIAYGSYENTGTIVVDFSFARGLKGWMNEEGTRIDWANREFWLRADR